MHEERQPAGDERGEPGRPRRRWGRRLLVALLVLVLVPVVWHWQAGRRAKRGLAAEMAACRAAGEPATVDELNRWPGLRSGEGENLVTLLRDALPIDQNTAAWRAATDSLNPPPLGDDEAAALAAVVAANAAALLTLDAAAAAGRIDWEPAYKSPLAQNIILSPHLNRHRALVNLLRAAALLAHHRGDDAEALRRVDQVLLVSRALDHQPFLVHHLTAVGCGAVGYWAAAQLAPDLRIGPAGAPPEQVRKLVAQLLDERPLNDGQRRAWVGERVAQFELPNAVLGGGGSVPFGGVNWNIPGARFAMKPMLYDNARAMAHYTTTVMNAMAASPDLPAFNARLGDPIPEVKQSPGRYTLASVLLPSLNRGAQQHYRALADRRLAATCLAVRLYAADHGGNLPVNLDDLVPQYLPAVPLDPLAGGGAPVRYVNEQSDPKRPRVYSVGPDGKDDGGAEAAAGQPSRADPDEVRHLRRQPRPDAADSPG
jgi:hypothetical protein